MFALWSLRLAGYLLFSRILQGIHDHRYTAMEARWGESFRLRRLGGFVFQGFLQSCLCSIFIDSKLGDVEKISSSGYACIAVFAVCLLGETVADLQLENFKADKKAQKTKDSLCRKGLWSVSRHPNYFFDFGCWVAFAAFIISEQTAVSVSSLTALVGPVSMWIIFRHITGPLTERLSVKRRGDVYKR